MNRPTAHSDFLGRTACWMRQQELAILSLCGNLVEQDIRVCRKQALFGAEWAKRRTRIQAQVIKRGISEAEWTKREAGIDISEMRRRVRLYRKWNRYEATRREAGDTGYSGLYYALSLVADRIGAQTSRGGSPIRSEAVSDFAAPRVWLSRVTFVTGDALIELRKMKSQRVHVAICSPPYWPLKRKNAGRGVGYEEKLADYIDYLVAVFREIRRILTDEGVLWIVLGDSYVKPGGVWHPDRKTDHNAGLSRQDTTYLRPAGNLLMIPARLAMALQDDGWVLRQEIIWNKGWCRPESVSDRVTRTHEMVYMFAKQRGYFYNPDPIREALAHTVTTRGGQRQNVAGYGRNCGFRISDNPMGRNSGSVWQIPPSQYRGQHDATFPEELVQRMLAVSCDDLEFDLIVLDPFGGAGTTAKVALEAGHRAITIDNNAAATRAARQRLADAASEVPTNETAVISPALAAE